MLNNLRLALPELEDGEHKRIAKASWANLIMTTLELVRFPRELDQMLSGYAAEDETLGAVETAVQKGKGVLLVVPHMGNWELAGAYMAKRYGVSVIARPMNQSRLAGAVNGIREGAGMRVYARKNALKGVLAALRRGDIVAVMYDQHAGKNGVQVEFFGQPVSVFASVAYLAKKTGAPVLLGCDIRLDDFNGHRGYAYEIPFIDTGDNERDAIANTQNYTKAIEDVVRKYPHCWMWMHRRFRGK